MKTIGQSIIIYPKIQFVILCIQYHFIIMINDLLAFLAHYRFQYLILCGTFHILHFHISSDNGSIVECHGNGRRIQHHFTIKSYGISGIRSCFHIHCNTRIRRINCVVFGESQASPCHHQA